MRTFATTRLLVSVLWLVGLLAVAGACNGEVVQPGGSTKITLTEFKFSPADVSVSAGKVTFYLVNSGTAFHEFGLQDSAGRIVAKTDRIQPGGSQLLTVDHLAPGSYRIVCEVAGHMESGMTGTLKAG
jgi:uncharacterized cupredoxin-like copper-binding protein